ncbi:unnamed protein product, partial [Mesorhabditis spiculigera]
MVRPNTSLKRKTVDAKLSSAKSPEQFCVQLQQNGYETMKMVDENGRKTATKKAEWILAEEKKGRKHYDYNLSQVIARRKKAMHNSATQSFL